MTQQMEQGMAAREFDQTWHVPMTPTYTTERKIADSNWRVVVVGTHEAKRLADDAEKFAEAFKGDCFIFETEEAMNVFDAHANPVQASKVRISTLGYIEQTNRGSNHPIFERADCIVCIGHPQMKIMGEIRKVNKNIVTDPIDLGAVIKFKNERKQSEQSYTHRIPRVI